MEVDFKIEGLKDLEKELLRIEKSVARKTLRGALSDALKPSQKRAKQLVPVDTHNLRRSIKRSSWFHQRRGAIAKLRAGGKVRGGGDPFYARMVEFGTVKMQAKPFMRPAFYGHERETIDIFKRRVLERMKKR